LEGDYTIVIQGDQSNNPIGTLNYSLNFQTSLAAHSPGHGAHPIQPCTLSGARSGPSSGDPVDLPTGEESYDPGADLTVYNPNGPDVDFSRHYSNDRALALSSSPGLATGWYESYDLHLESNGDGTNWPSMDVVYPNGARETLLPRTDGNNNLILDANGQAQFSTPFGSAYIATASPDTSAKVYSDVRMMRSDGTTWNFRTPSANSNKALLYSIGAPTTSPDTVQALLFQWIGDDRDDYHLSAVLNASDSKTLLSLSYSGDPVSGYLLTQISDCYGRSVYYANASLAGASNVSILTDVSMIASTGTQAPQRCSFGYANFNGSPFLSGITVPHPNDANQTATAQIFYGSDGRVAREVDGNGNTTAFSYGTGQTLVETLNAAGTVETQHTALFDSRGRNIGTLDAEQNATSIVYGDANNPDRPTSVTDAASRTTFTSYEPNGFGLVNTVTTPRGVSTHYGYNYSVWPFGLLMQKWESTGSGATLVNHPPTTFTYLQGWERAGLVSQITSPHPNAGVAGWMGPTTVDAFFTYNEYGDVTSTTTPGHGGYGSLSSSLSYTTDGAYTQATQRGHVVSATDEAGQTSGFRYNSRGDQIWAHDELGNVTTRTYDIADNVTSQTLPATGQTGSGAGHVEFVYTFLGGTLKTTNSFDESGSTTPFRSVTTNFDAEGRTVSVGGATEPVAYTYTSFGAPKTLSDGSGHTTSYSYDGRGLLRQIVRPGGNTATGFDVVSFNDYAPDGQLLSETDGRGLTTTFQHQDPDGETSQINLPDETITLARDAWGRLTGRSDASGSQLYAYSDADALVSTATNYQRADGSFLPPLVLNNVYEADGARSQLFGSNGSATEAINLAYRFDPRGQMTQLQDNAQNLASSWSYDAKARLTGASQPNGWTRGTTYNALDQVLALGQSNPNVGAMNFGHPSDPNQQLRYDGAGNMVRETANFGNINGGVATGTTNYGYDAADRLTGENSNRFGSYGRTYALDGAFNRTGATGVSGTAPSWSQTLSGNGNNQVTGGAFTQNGTTSNTGYTYDGEGNRTSRTTSNGTTVTRPTSPSSQMQMMAASASTASGSTTNQGQTVTSTSTTSGSSTTFYAFDSQNRLTQVSQSSNGGVAAVVMKAGYRADGLRAWKENAQGVRTYFLYDGSNLVGEFDSSGVMQVSQTWGAEGLSYRRTASGASAGNRFYSWDVRGNIAATTEATGAVLNTPASDGFSSSGGSEPCATFGGQVGGYRDAETGLVLFGQRYYDSSLGSWLTRDPIAEEGGINIYSYVKGNPTNRVDPDGLQEVMPFPGEWGALPRIGALPRVGAIPNFPPYEVLPPMAQARGHGGGKNAQHASEAAREAARIRYEAARQAYDELAMKPNKTPQDKKDLDKLNRAKKKAKDDMDYTGVNHSGNAKGNQSVLPPYQPNLWDRFKNWWNDPGPTPPMA
jgi:RHS repeat-associated protein